MRLCRRRRRAVFLLSLSSLALLFYVLRYGVGNVANDNDVGPGRKAPRATKNDAFSNILQGQGHRRLRIAAVEVSEVLPSTYASIVNENESRIGDDGNSSKNASELFKESHWMTIQGGGRLGNAMFQYASLVGISGFHGYQPRLASSHYLRRIFKITSPHSTRSRQNMKSKKEKNPGIYDSDFEDLSHATNWSLVGYFQSWRYFQNNSDEVKQEFTFKDDIMREMLKEAPVLANWSRPTVGVHVRRGDMASRYERDRGYHVASLGFLNRSMNYFRAKYENPLFLICSDSIKWCRENIASDDTIFMNGRREVDLAILAHCDHNIVTSGSFGWWGAWLAGGDVVYFKHFPRENSWLDKQYSKEDYYLPSWIPMD